MKNAEQNGVLRWTGKLLSADDLRRHLHGQRELIVQRQAIVTPLAVDELKKLGVRLLRDDNVVKVAGPARGSKKHGFAQERARPNPLISSAVQALAREGVILEPMFDGDGSTCEGARQLAECVARGDCQRAVVFCADPGLVCCVANKIPGLRAVSVLTVSQAARGLTSLAANLLAVEMPGRTYFEVRQILLNLCRASTECPANIADTLRELDGHAHR